MSDERWAVVYDEGTNEARVNSSLVSQPRARVVQLSVRRIRAKEVFK